MPVIDAAPVYHLYGLRVRSEIRLPAPIAADDHAACDLHLCWGERRPLADELPPGELLAQLILEDGRGYTLVADGAGYILSFCRTAECRIDPDLRGVRIHLAPDVATGIAGLLVVGNVMAAILTLAGEAILHASTVALDGAALAFLGSSGMGKSSLAGQLCANGAIFVTDDLLRLQADGAGWRCYGGAGQLRLRPDAAARCHFPADLLEATPDERVAVNLAPDPTMPRLAAIVIPHPSPRCAALTLERLAPTTALLRLMAYPRMQDLARKVQRQRRLDTLGRIAAGVPVFTAEIPWGAAFSVELAASLVQKIHP